jgi:hypothetical protein
MLPVAATALALSEPLHNAAALRDRTLLPHNSPNRLKTLRTLYSSFPRRSKLN